MSASKDRKIVKMHRMIDERETEIERLRNFAEEVRRRGDTRLASMAIAVLSAARATGWTCPKCDTDRTKAACPKGHSAASTGQCPMMGTAT